MKVTNSLVPDFNSIKSYNPVSKRQSDSDLKKSDALSKDEITISKFKKTLSECKYAVLAASILYFAVKKVFIKEEIITQAIKRNKLNKLNL